MMISVENLSFSYQEHTVLQRISFQTQPGLTAVLGPNGVGKSTLFQCMLGLRKGYTGSVRYDDKEVSDLTPRDLAQMAAYIPQRNHPAFGYPVFDVVLMGTSGRLSPFSVPGEREKQAAQTALETVGIAHLAQRNFLKLSGGEQQLVLIARALAQQTEILLMDEPTASLDYGNQLRVLERIRCLGEQGYTILMSTHDPQSALTYAQRVLALHEGRIIAEGAPGEVITPELLHTLYGVVAQVKGNQVIGRIAP